MAYPCRCVSTIFAIVLIFSIFRVNAQISTPCSASMVSSFTPCLNFVTGSSGTGASPTEECCDSLKSLMTDNMDCTCLIVTGNVPVSVPFINANLAISLPQACKSSVPLQCKATGVPLPAPGPVLFGPTRAPVAAAPAPVLAPTPAHHRHGHSPRAPAPNTHAQIPKPLAPAPNSHAHSPKASKATATAAPPPVESTDVSPGAAPPRFSLGPSANPGIRPVVNHESAASPPAVALPSLLLAFAGIMGFKFF